MTAGGHVALVRLRLGNVDNAVEEVSFAVLPAEILRQISYCKGIVGIKTDPAENVVMVGQVRLADFTAVDAGRV